MSEETKVTCVVCGKEFDIKNVEELAGDRGYVCTNCYVADKDHDRFERCADCGLIIDKDNDYYMTTHDGDTICESCYDDNYFRCEACDEIYHVDDAVPVRLNDRTHEYICPHCRDYNDEYRICDECGQVVRSGDGMWCGDEEGCFVCFECIEEGDNYGTCDRCGFLFYIDSLSTNQYTNQYLCEDCNDIVNDEEGVIKGYGNYAITKDDKIVNPLLAVDTKDVMSATKLSRLEYYLEKSEEEAVLKDKVFELQQQKNFLETLMYHHCALAANITDVCYCINEYHDNPSFVFYTDKTPDAEGFGFELEFQFPKRFTQDEIAESISDKASDMNRIYFTKDGSLDNGFEIVSNTMDQQDFIEWYNNRWKDTLQWMLDNDCLSNNAFCSCGLHWHINISSLHPAQIISFWTIINGFPNFWIPVGRRNSNRFAEYDYAGALALKELAEKNGNIILERMSYKGFRIIQERRYSACNLYNTSTIEVRLFRGTVCPEDFLVSFLVIYGAFLLSKRCTYICALMNLNDNEWLSKEILELVNTHCGSLYAEYVKRYFAKIANAYYKQDEASFEWLKKYYEIESEVIVNG